MEKISRYYSHNESEMAILCEQLRPGYLLEFDRKSYRHWAVYTGHHWDTHWVVHFTMIEANPAAAARYKSAVLEQPIEEVWLNDTCRLNLSGDLNPGWTARSVRDILRYTILQLESAERSPYDIVSNNCEHFAHMCRYGKAYSSQVNYATNVASGVGYGLALAAGLWFGKEACINALHGIDVLSFLGPKASPLLTPHITNYAMNNTDKLTSVRLMPAELENSCSTHIGAISRSVAGCVIQMPMVQVELAQIRKWVAKNILNIGENRLVNFENDSVEISQNSIVRKLVEPLIRLVNQIRVAVYSSEPVRVRQSPSFGEMAVNDTVKMVFQMASSELKSFVVLLINEVGEFFGVGKSNINSAIAGLEIGLSDLADELKKFVNEIIKYIF